MKTFLLIKIITIILLCSCNYKQIKNEAPQVNFVRVNEKFRINLPEEHNSGYMWQLKNTYDKKHIEHIGDVWHGEKKGIDFNFKALSKGQTTLSVIKRKYVDTIDSKNFIVKIIE